MTFLRRFYVSNTALPSDNVNYKRIPEQADNTSKSYIQNTTTPLLGVDKLSGARMRLSWSQKKIFKISGAASVSLASPRRYVMRLGVFVESHSSFRGCVTVIDVVAIIFFV